MGPGVTDVKSLHVEMQADDQCEVVSGIIAISNVYLCDKVKK